MIGSALIPFLALILTATVALGVTTALVEETNQMHRALDHAAQVNRFAGGVDSSYRALDLLRLPSYPWIFYLDERTYMDRLRTDLDTTLRDPYLPAADRIPLVKIINEFDRLNPKMAQLNELARQDQAAAQRQWLNAPYFYGAAMQTLRGDALNLAFDMNAEAVIRASSVQQWQARVEVIIPAIAVIGLIFGAGLTILVVRHTVTRLARITRDIQRLAEGDLTLPTQPLHLRRASRVDLSDEVLLLEQSYTRTVETLRDPLQQIQTDAARISAASSEIGSAAGYQAMGASEQATAITQVTVTVEELNQTAAQIADAATGVAVAAEQALSRAGGGQEAVRDSIIGMAMIRSRVSDITTRILALSAQSQRITEIIDVIDQMAAQTHILALNAAVESAGAGGEIGERFGVVAAEVKKLAQRSALATHEIRTVIAQVQAATNAAVMATEDGLKETDKGVAIAHQSGKANEDIIGMVERTAQLAHAISLATQQQRTASEQVVTTMREIAQVTRQAATGSAQSSRAAAELSEIARALQTVTERFHLQAAAEVCPPTTVPSADPLQVALSPPMPHIP